ncbi:hypothetical protein GSUB_17365 (plasmid) [Geoalkalibacter subterraneus]|uniref:Uncharacterized protein n=2 Tax=Geoalkalibacter subterraneus TaxID=483547 RepID=A0A0B5FXD4_9BACT|nr:hypothetical protein GSUB_17365 [Geoalkalibacter subterraneus]
MTWEECKAAAAKGCNLNSWEGYTLARDKIWIDKRNQKINLEDQAVERKILPLYQDTLKVAYERREKHGIIFRQEVVEEQSAFFKKIGADIEQLLAQAHPKTDTQMQHEEDFQEE